MCRLASSRPTLGLAYSGNAFSELVRQCESSLCEQFYSDKISHDQSSQSTALSVYLSSLPFFFSMRHLPCGPFIEDPDPMRNVVKLFIRLFTK